MPSICETPPDFTLLTYGTDAPFTLSSHSGKVILLSFMNLHCSHCWSFFPRWNTIASMFSGDPNVEIVTVVFNSDPEDITDALIDGKLADYGLTAPEFTVLKDAGGWGDVATTYRSGFTGSVWFPYAYLISRSHVIANMWHWKSTDNGAVLSFDSGNDDDVENFIVHRIQDLLVDRPRWNSILALDYSGSMDTVVSVAGTSKAKIDFLREAAGAWLQVWKDYALPDDRLGVVYFADHATSDGTLVPILPGDNVESVLDALDDRDADGCTALGAAVATGIDVLETDPLTATDPAERFMVLFSDGKQNRNPRVSMTADCSGGSCVLERQIRNVDSDEIELMGFPVCGSNGGSSDYAGPLPRILEGNPMATKIHTIGIGAPDGGQGLLGTIADATSGVTYLDTEIWPNLTEFFLESLVESFRGSSLCVVARSAGTLAANESAWEQTFVLSKTVRRATIVVGWVDPANPLSVEVRKGGLLLDVDNKQTRRETSTLTTLPFPLYQSGPGFTVGPMTATATAAAPSSVMAVDFGRAPRIRPLQQLHRPRGFTVESEGDYTITLRRQFPSDAPVSFHVMVLADDKGIAASLELPRQVYFTDEHIPLDVRVLDDGRLVRKVYSAEVTVDRPLTALGNLYAEHHERIRAELGAGGRDAIVGAMLADSKLGGLLADRETDRVVLTPAHRVGHRRGAGPVGHFR
ncbi:MAG: VWA domain-containing protein, partial [Nannocystaceae bacterium]